MSLSPKKAFGKQLRAIRKSKGLSQEALGELAGLHLSYISRIERGVQNVSVDNIAKLAKALRVSPSSLFK